MQQHADKKHVKNQHIDHCHNDNQVKSESLKTELTEKASNVNRFQIKSSNSIDDQLKSEK